MSDDRELKLKVKVEDEASKPLKQIGDSADGTKDHLEGMDTGLKKLGDSADGAKTHIEGMNLGLKKLDGQISDTKRTITDLREEIAKSGDLDLTKDLQKQEQRLKAFERQRKSILGGDGKSSLLGDAEKDVKNYALIVAKKLPEAFKLQAIASAGDGAGLAIGAPIVAGLVSYLGGVAAGGILATAAVGAVAGGVALAAQDARVQSAAADLGSTISAGLKAAAAPFVPATLKSIGIVKAAFQELGGDLQSIFGDSSGYLEPLTRGVVGFVREFVSGFKDAVAAAGPVVDMLGRKLPDLGKALGFLFSEMAAHANEGAVALGYLFGIADAGIKLIAGSIGVLSTVFKYLDLAGAALSGNYGHLAEYIKGNKEATPASNAFADALKNVGGQAKTAGLSLEDLNSAMVDYQTRALEGRAATRGLEQAIADGTAAFKKNGKTLDDHTQKGRDNNAALDAIAKSTEAVYASTLKNTGSQVEAEKAAQRGKDAFIALATKMYGSASAAQALADKLFGIPSPKVSISVHDQQALDAARAVQQSLGKIQDVHVGVYVTTHGSAQGVHLGTGTQLKYSEGGRVSGPGQKGVDSVPILAAPGEYVLTAADVDAAGGPGAIDRMRRQLRGGQAAATAVGGGGGAGIQRVEHVLRIEGDDRGIIGAFIKALRGAGGNPAVLGV